MNVASGLWASLIVACHVATLAHPKVAFSAPYPAIKALAVAVMMAAVVAAQSEAVDRALCRAVVSGAVQAAHC